MSTVPVPNKTKGGVGKGWVTPPDTPGRSVHVETGHQTKGTVGEGWATPPNATGRSHHVDQRMAREAAAKDRARSFLGNGTKHLPELSTLRPRCRSRSTRVAVGDRVATPPDARAQGQHPKAPGPRTRPRGSPPPPRYDGPGASRVRRERRLRRTRRVSRRTLIERHLTLRRSLIARCSACRWQPRPSCRDGSRPRSSSDAPCSR